MKFLSRLILMCLTLELIVAPIKPEMAMITILKANAAETCSAGMSWSDAANRCLVNASTAQTQRDLENCAKSSDPKSCYEANANKAANGKNTTQLNSGDVQAMYKGNSLGLNIAKTAAYSLPLMLFGYMLISHKKKEKRCLPPSTIAMMTAGVAMLAGEVYGYIKHKSNLKKLDEARKKLLTPEATDNLDQKKVNASQMQSEAFQLLADEQASVESLAKAKKTFYAVSMSAYGVAAGLATYELVSISLAKKKLITAVAKASAAAAGDQTKATQLTQLQADYQKLNISQTKFEASKKLFSKEVITKTQDDLATSQAAVVTAQKDYEDKQAAVKDAKNVRKEMNKNGTEDEYWAADDKVKDANKAKRQSGRALSSVERDAKNFQQDLDKLTATSQGFFPDVAIASTNLKKLLVNYECWTDTSKNSPKTTNTQQTAPESNPIENGTQNLGKPNDGQECMLNPGDEDNSPLMGKYKNGVCVASTSNLKSHDLKNLRLIATQINNLKNARSVEELQLLTEELELIKNGGIESQYNEIDKTANLQSPADKMFLDINSKMIAEQTYNEYFQLPKMDDAQIAEKIFTSLKNNIGISSAHAGDGGGLMSIIAIVPAILGASSLLKGNKKSAGAGYSTPGSDGATQPSLSPEELDKNTTVENTRDGFGAFVRTPTFRIAFGAVLGTLTYFMTKEMADQQKLAKARKETLLALKGDFENTQGMRICTPDERNDQSQPGCYCYTAEGTRNSARANSTVCQNMWSSVNLNGNSYLANTGDGTKVCITQSNQVDESCSCRTSGTCLKASGFNISGISLGTLSTLGSGLSPINTVASGNGASLNTDAVINGAMKLRDATDKVLKSKDLQNDNVIVKAAEKAMGNFVNANGGSLSAPSSRSTPSSLAGFDAKAALEDLKKEVESSPNISGSTGAGVGFGTQSSEPSLEFGLTEDEAAIQEQQVAEVLNQDMDLGNNDISTSNSNIFELLTHRYQRSGMRRLFDTEGKTQPEAPAETDVNK